MSRKKRISELVDIVFGLSDKEKYILLGLVREGPINKNRLFEFLEKSKDSHVSYSKFQNLLYGSRNHAGLVKTEYIVEVLENKKRSGNPEKTLYLNVKGIIAIMSEYPIQNNQFFKMYFENLKSIITIGDHEGFLKEYIESQINIFILCHGLQGINLKRHNNFGFYFHSFLKHIDFEIDIAYSKQDKDIFIHTIVEYFIHHNCFVYILDGHEKIANTFPTIFRSKETKLKKPSNEWTMYIYKWTVGFYDVLLKQDPDTVLNVNREFLVQEFKEGVHDWLVYAPKIDKKLKKLGVKKSIMNKSLKNILMERKNLKENKI